MSTSGYVELFIRATFDIDNVCAPNFVGLRVTAEWLAMQARRAQACRDLVLAYVEAEEFPRHIDMGASEVTFGSWMLQLDSESFRFVGKADGGGNCRSDWVSVADTGALLESLGADGVRPDAFSFYGGAAFYTDDDVGYLIENVTEALPEVNAMETHLQMADAIETSAQAPAAPAAESPPTAPARRLKTLEEFQGAKVGVSCSHHVRICTAPSPSVLRARDGVAWARPAQRRDSRRTQPPLPERHRPLVRIRNACSASDCMAGPRRRDGLG
jgi:hypothetical protein